MLRRDHYIGTDASELKIPQHLCRNCRVSVEVWRSGRSIEMVRLEVDSTCLKMSSLS